MRHDWPNWENLSSADENPKLSHINCATLIGHAWKAGLRF